MKYWKDRYRGRQRNLLSMRETGTLDSPTYTLDMPLSTANCSVVGSFSCLLFLTTTRSTLKFKLYSILPFKNTEEMVHSGLLGQHAPSRA